MVAQGVVSASLAEQQGMQGYKNRFPFRCRLPHFRYPLCNPIMRSTVIAILASASTALAAPPNATASAAPLPTLPPYNASAPFPKYPHCHPHQCLTQRFAEDFVERFSHVLTHTASDLGSFEQTMEIMLAKDFQEESGSINSLAGHPVSASRSSNEQKLTLLFPAQRP